MLKKPWQVKGPFSKVAKNNSLLKLALLSILLNLTIIFVIIILEGRLPPEVPLFYGVPEGQEQLAPSISLIIPPITSLVIVLLNSGLSFLTQSSLLKNFLVVTAATTSVFSTITVLKIIFLVGSI